MHQKTLEAVHTRFRERSNVGGVPWNNPSPRRPIDAALVSRCLALGLERGGVGRSRNAVQRHIDQRGISPGCSGGCYSFEAAPIGSPGFVDMDMRIDKSGQNDQVLEIFFVCMSRNFVPSNHIFNPIVLYEQRAGTNSLRGDDAAR